MSGRSGEMARRAALGIGSARNGAQVAQALQTIRFSALDRRRPDPNAQRSALLSKRKDKGHLLWALRHEAARMEAGRAETVDRLEKLGPRDSVEVTDHALVRFLERALGIDVNTIRAEIARLVPAGSLEADRVIYVRGGLQFLLSQNSIVTVLDGHMDSAISEAFSIDETAIDAPRPVKPQETAASVAARTLARQAQRCRAKFLETTARLRAEMGMAAQ